MVAIDEILAIETPAFARAVNAIIAGDATGLRTELGAEPGLVHARSRSGHHATLLHYVSANGIEEELHSLFRTPMRSRLRFSQRALKPTPYVMPIRAVPPR
jgi:hypothetical protein